MSENVDFEEMLEAYHHGKVVKHELLEQIKANPENQVLYDQYLEDLVLAKSGVKMDLKQKATTAYLRHKKERKIKLIIISIVSLILLFLAYLTLNSINQVTPLSNDQLYARHFIMPEVSNMRSTEKGNEVWSEVINAYQNKSYTSVITLMDSILRSNTSTPPASSMLILGTSYAQEGKYNEALAQLQKIPHTSTLWIEGQWYQGLLNLKLGKTEKAKLNLQNVVNFPGNYKEKESTRLIEALKKKD